MELFFGLYKTINKESLLFCIYSVGLQKDNELVWFWLFLLEIFHLHRLKLRNLCFKRVLWRFIEIIFQWKTIHLVLTSDKRYNMSPEKKQDEYFFQT